MIESQLEKQLGRNPIMDTGNTINKFCKHYVIYKVIRSINTKISLLDNNDQVWQLIFCLRKTLGDPNVKD